MAGMDLRIGTHFAGHRIEGVIGSGGASVVYLAEHLRLGRKVALKILAPQLAEDPAFRERFIRESRLAASLDHANIVAIYDAGEVEDTLYISMRYVDGPDLGKILRIDGPLDPSRTLAILSQVADALDAAHMRGMVHRDVKPGNVLIEGSPDATDRAYLADFGISKRATATADLTQTGQFVGTVDYVAPEQITGGRVDERTDVYSLGCVLYQCLSGEVPFASQFDVATIYRHLNEPPPSLKGFLGKREQLNLVLAKALAKAKEDRYDTCSALMGDVRKVLLGGSPTVAVDAPAPAIRQRESKTQAEADIDQQPPGNGERTARKTVTVVFCDVIGSAVSDERLDPESMRSVTSRYFERMKEVLESHGATVEKIIGDAVMAVFGVPLLHEDDALRACRAAMAMQEELSRLNAELERDWDVALAIRTGVNTGEVIAGDPSSGTAVTGNAVNTAARLKEAAAFGEVLIGASTYRLVRAAVDAVPVEPIPAKAKAEPMAAYRLQSIIPGAPIHERRLDSPMVGRKRELQQLREALERATNDRTCVLATVVGSAGVGKSRLTDEFVASISDDVAVLRGRCLSYGEGITFWPVTEVVRQAAGITVADTPKEARSRIESLLPRTGERPIIAKRVAAAIGIGEAAPIHETFWAIRKFVEALAEDRPLIVVFDDLHWAEPTFIDFVEYIAGSSNVASILVICLARSELTEMRPEWASGVQQTVTVILEPLTESESHALIRNLLGAGEISTEIGSRIAQTAEGNPLFLEELTELLLEENRLRQEDGRWLVTGDLSSIPTPPTVQNLLSARVERLPEEQRAILLRASVVGEVFWWGAVADLSLAMEQPGVGANLQKLVRKGVIRPDESTFAGEDAFRFRHILIREAAYHLLPRATRADLHERFARWLEGIVGERAEEYEEILGFHWSKLFVREWFLQRPIESWPLELRSCSDRRASAR
jgi:serine/threonine protein kinase